MAVTATPIFTQTVQTTVIQTTGTANTNTDGSTGSYSAAYTAGANGSLLDYINFVATATTVASKLRIFYAADGSTYRLIGEVLAAAVTASNTVATQNLVWVPNGGIPFAMKAGSKIIFNQNAGTEIYNCILHTADY